MQLRSRGSPRSWLSIGAVVVSAVSASVSAQQVKAPDAKERAHYQCAAPTDARQRIQVAIEWRGHQYDKNTVACAADVLFEASNAAPNDAMLAREALHANLTYLDVVTLLKAHDLVGYYEEEWDLRLAHGNQQAEDLVKRLNKVSPDDPDSIAMEAATTLVVHQFDNLLSVSLAVKEAKTLLNRAIAKKPTAFDGWGMTLLGRLYYELPAILGGDNREAVAILERAYQQTPDNIQLLRYLAEAYDQDLAQDKALTVLKAVLALPEPKLADRQLTADELRMAQGLASRLGAEDLSEQLRSRRVAFLAQHPELNPRVSAQVAGHGGDNPITGESQY